jgi:hypothetical protein
MALAKPRVRYPAPVPVAVGVRMAAHYAGRCSLCNAPYRSGDLIGYCVEQGWVCENCGVE